MNSAIADGDLKTQRFAELGAPRVVVAHHGRQHSHQLAQALAEAGLLAQYITGVPAHRNAGWRWARPLLRRYAGAYATPLKPSLVRHVFITPLASKATAPWVSRRFHVSLDHLAKGWFDSYVSSSIVQLRPSMVIAYENSSLATFRVAKAHGIVTVLDAASVHHAWQDRYCEPVESFNSHKRICARKDAELRLADYVLTASNFARQSYLEAGVSTERVVSLPLGVTLATFQPVQRPSDATEARPLRFVFVGNASRLKGLDILCDAVRTLQRDELRIQLTVVGNPGPDTPRTGALGIIVKGWMSHEQLAQELRTHDVLVLPSRFDSFGMVVAEAMASGLPPIVSDHVGAKEMVTPGTNGLVVPAGDTTALANAMAWVVAHRDRLPAMSAAARAAAEQYSWERYRLHSAAIVKDIAAQAADRKGRTS
jgi:glycosyltransferase involved in cell wall biosynthesis